MALYDQYTLLQLRTLCRRELLDPTGTAQWSWPDSELNQYLTEWQDGMQDRFEFVWGTATLTNVGTATSTFTLSAIDPAMLRLDRIFWNQVRMVGRSKTELDMMQRDWRASNPGIPQVAYQDDVTTVSVWPRANAVTPTVVFEYPLKLSFVDDTTAMGLPAWVRYSAVNYVCWRAYMRPGPNEDQRKAARRLAKLNKQSLQFKTMYEQHFPDKTPTLRPGGKYEGDILTLGQHNTLYSVWY